MEIIKLKPSEFYDEVMNNIIETNAIYTIINNKTYLYYMGKIFCENSIYHNIILNKEELTKYFKPLLRKEKLLKLKERINE
jgi:hypothetical protein